MKAVTGVTANDNNIIPNIDSDRGYQPGFYRTFRRGAR